MTIQMHRVFRYIWRTNLFYQNVFASTGCRKLRFAILRSDLSKNLRTYLPVIKYHSNKKYLESADDSLSTDGNVDRMHWRVRRVRCRSNLGTIRRIHSDYGYDKPWIRR